MSNLEEYGGTREDAQAAYHQAEMERLDEMDRRELSEMAEQNKELNKLERSSRAGKQFVNSDLGRFMLERAIKGRDEALSKLVGLKRSDYNSQFNFYAKFDELQNEALIPNLLFTWIAEAIQAASDAGIITNEEDENDH